MTEFGLNSTLHPLCACAQAADGSGLLGNYPMCDRARTQLCQAYATPTSVTQNDRGEDVVIS